MQNYLHEFTRVFFSNQRLIKRFFLFFAVLTVLLTLVLKQSFDVTAEILVQSKKLSQTDASTSLTAETDKFVPTSLTDMETEGNILRSPSLSRQTLIELMDKNQYEQSETLIKKVIITPVKNFLVMPLKLYVINPVRKVLGLEVDPLRDTRLDEALNEVMKNLKVETLPGSNVIQVTLSSRDPAQGTRFVQQLLNNYLRNRQDLQSNDLPEAFYEQKKGHYQERIDSLEKKRLGVLEQASSSDPTEEITFRLNAINTEEQSLNGYHDKLLESEAWLDYLKSSLAKAKESRGADFSFPFTFKQLVGDVAYEDREIADVGEKLTGQVMRYNTTLLSFNHDSQPVKEQRKQLFLTHQQFLNLVGNRIEERQQEYGILKEAIAQKTVRIQEFKDRIAELQTVQSKLRQLDTEIDALHKAFFAYTQRYEESQGQHLLDAAMSNARVLSQPYEPAEAAFPKPGLIIPLGLITGFLIAVSLGYVREFFDHTFKVPTQINEHLDLPVLLVIDADVVEAPNPHKPWSLAWMWHWIRQ